MPLKSELVVRPAHARDWPAVAGLLEANGLPLAGAREHLSAFLLAFRGAQLLACIGAEPYGDDALLRSAAVAPDAQRCGIGTRLVEQALVLARSRGLSGLYLRTTTAAGFFARFGFRVVQLAAVPAAVQSSAEFKGACPASATTMHLALNAPSATADETRSRAPTDAEVNAASSGRTRAPEPRAARPAGAKACRR